MTVEDKENDKRDQIERGKRIKYIRENELKLTKTQLGKMIGISSQFLGLVEDGRGNLSYRSLKKFRLICEHSTDYILYGLDDEVIEKTSKYLRNYSELEISCAIENVKRIILFMKKRY